MSIAFTIASTHKFLLQKEAKINPLKVRILPQLAQHTSEKKVESRANKCKE